MTLAVVVDVVVLLVFVSVNNQLDSSFTAEGSVKYANGAGVRSTRAKCRRTLAIILLVQNNISKK